MKTYTQKDIRKAFLNVGIEKSDTVFVHANLGFFGKLDGAKAGEDYAETFMSELKEIIGPGGNICVPTFTYSFCNNQPFDYLNTASQMGIFAEYIRTLPESKRSCDANFSVSVLGAAAKYLTENTSSHSFGRDSFWDRFTKENGKVLNMNFDAGSTYIHFVEKMMNVPYRYDKGFTGQSLIDGVWQEQTFYHFVRHLDKPDWDTSMTRFDRLARKKSITLTANLGNGNILSMRATEVYTIIQNVLIENPYYLTTGQGELE